MHYSPQNEECPMALNPFKACVAPRPIGWISTVSRDGIDNLAPFSQFQNLSYDPPMVMIAINQGGDEPDHVHRKDTVNNIESTGWKCDGGDKACDNGSGNFEERG